jgi:hypothetical protein
MTERDVDDLVRRDIQSYLERADMSEQEPSVETAEGREELRRLADREYSLEPDWYVPFQAALHALDARDAALAEQAAKIEVLGGQRDRARREVDLADQQLAEVRAAAIEECAALIDDPRWEKPDEGEQWWASDYASAAKRRAAEKIRALKDPVSPGEICPYCGNRLGSHWQDCPTCAGAGDPRDPG